MFTRIIADNIQFLAQFRRSFKNPRKVQEKVLLRILKRNQNSLYGRIHNFSSIKSIEEYQGKVPIVSYEDIKPYIERLKNGEKNILTKDKVIYFATTSGTTKAVKLIPVTKERERIFRRELAIWSLFVLSKNKKILKGKTLYFAGPYLEFYTNKGIPCGSISGYLAHKSPWFVKQKLVVNPKTYNEMNFDKKTRKIAIAALKSDITQIGFASPIEAILFFDYLKDNKNSLLRQLRIDGKMKLVSRLSKLEEFKPAEIWPNLHLINCIKSKTNQIYLETLKEKLGREDIEIRDPGIYSSEGRLSLCIEKEGIAGIIPANENFFE
ncbi:MAG: GH3 family domain-containing protein, partial [Candidatus Nanoarchaeia archaeon]